LGIASEISGELERFSAIHLANGTFWEEPQNSILADYGTCAHKLLIQAVVNADQSLDGENNPVLRRLLLLTVLIKYLEDRHVFPNEDWFGQYRKGAKSFFNVLQSGEPTQVLKLLNALEQKFDGDVFSLPVGSEKALSKDNLAKLSILIEARTIGNQRCLWKMFSFEHIPVEVISNIYQRFARGGPGAVYTPPILVSLILDYVMPYSRLNGKEHILDPACGSGIFLVGAFRRLVNIWRANNGWKLPTVEVLKSILKNSIYGIELDSSAADLTAFSMCLAVCDALQPDVIWKNLKFDRLRESNLQNGDFFKMIRDSRENLKNIFTNKFDIIVGNPPFDSRLSLDGVLIDKESCKQNKRGRIPDNQIAYLFLEQSLLTLREGGHLCLLQPHGLIYNENSRNFFRKIISVFYVNTILDFTSIRSLFDEADSKTIAVLAENKKPHISDSVKHLTFRRTVSVKQRICFELDHYDHHVVRKVDIESNPFVWRVNILGGGRLLDLSKRIQAIRTLKEYIKQRNWDYGEGCIVAKTGKLIKAPFLHKKPYLPSNALTEEGIDRSKIHPFEETSFRSVYSEDRYTAPLILIRETGSLQMDFLDEGFLVYRNQIVGIHAPVSDKEKLFDLYSTIRKNRDIYKLSCTLNGRRSLISKATSILKEDIDRLPSPEDLSQISFSFWEIALREDVLKYMTEYVRLGQNCELLANSAKEEDLAMYSQMFCRMLKPIYDNIAAATPVFLSGLTCQLFYFGDHPNFPLLEESVSDIQKLIYHEDRNASLRTVRMLRIYAHNCLLIVKPDRLRYWIRTTAIRDADETLIDLSQQGY
jgi:hypothetical protein